MNANSRYLRFLENVTEEDLRAELLAISDSEEEIASRFGEELSFGTAGLRGILGVGTSRMNVYTVSRATRGVFDVISPKKQGERATFVVGFDTRIASDLFARRTAEVLSSCGARVYLADEPIPVPLVSFVTRALRADAGICITASHNPAAYNGYKVFDSTGSQFLEEEALEVSRAAGKHDYFEPIASEEGEVLSIPSRVFDSYFSSLKARFAPARDNLSIVYTPLCGTGLRFVPRALFDAGFSQVRLVEEQARHDGRFPTCEKPNPEVQASLALAIALSEKHSADLFLATDPDCDRVGVGVKSRDGYRLLSGNETGLLLMDYLLKCAKREGRLSPETFVCTTIVSAQMADAIAADYGVTLCRTLTGFKYIGEQIGLLEKAGKKDTFLFGFEESYGCLASTDVRDKDACEACVLVCRMASEYQREGKSLLDALEELSARYGIYDSLLKNYEFSSPAAAQEKRRVLSNLRETPPREFAGFAADEVMDCLSGTVTKSDGSVLPLALPKADVLAFSFGDRARMMMRPSGTEPKVKLYLFAHADTEEETREILSRLSAFADELFL